jgi:hypothetical protein
MVGKRKSETPQEEGEDDDGNSRRKRLEDYQIKGLEDYFLNVDIYPTAEQKV